MKSANLVFYLFICAFFSVVTGKIQWPAAWFRKKQSAFLCSVWMARSLHTGNQTGGSSMKSILLPLQKQIKSSDLYLSDRSFHSQQLVTANTWSSIAILCGVFMALFKAANFAKLTIQWIIRMRKRHLRNKAKEMTPVTDNWVIGTVKVMTSILTMSFVILSQNYVCHHKDIVPVFGWM